MSDNQDRPRSETDAELEREIRKGRKFTLEEAIGRMAGPGAMKELVRNADVEWGRVFGERPHFDKEGSLCHPNDPYTVESVRNALFGIRTQLEAGVGSTREDPMRNRQDP
jgi:hypothetical protein